MGFFKNIFNKIIGKEEQKLLGEGTQNKSGIEGETRKSKFRKDLVNSAKKLTPEQWQKKFFEYKGLGNFAANPYSFKYLQNIPAIAQIQDKESYEQAIENVKMSLSEGYNFVEQGASYSVNFRENESAFAINVVRERSGVTRGPAFVKQETRQYDKKSSLEMERRLISVKLINGREFKTDNRYKRLADEGEKIGIVKEGDITKSYYDLTTSKADIKSLDGINSENLLNQRLAISDVDAKKIGIMSSEVDKLINDEDYKQRLSEKVGYKSTDFIK